jgi:hypothetical protein
MESTAAPIPVDRPLASTKILITGTGRCGTTFLIKLFSFLGFHTGYNRQNFIGAISRNCNSGMERKYNEPFAVLKNPLYILQMETIMQDPSVNVTCVIIPIRKFEDAAISRVRKGRNAGGLWNASDAESQIQHYYKIMSEYLYVQTKYEIPSLFLDFDQMVSDPRYLFRKFQSLMEERDISYEQFADVYEEASKSSRP